MPCREYYKYKKKNKFKIKGWNKINHTTSNPKKAQVLYKGEKTSKQVLLQRDSES